MFTFTIISQESFLIQFLITLPVTVYLYTKYKVEWLNFEKFFFAFFVMITVSNFLAIFLITQTGVGYALIIISSFLALVFLLIASETLLGVRNPILLYVLPFAIFLFDSTINMLYAIGYSGINDKVWGAITGIDILIITTPSIVIYAYLTYKTKDISLVFFVLALLLYIIGGISLNSSGETGQAVFYTLAVICFAIATILPIIRNRIHQLSPSFGTSA